MKLTLLYFMVLLLAILLLCDQSGVEAKKKKHGKGGDRYEIKGKDYNKENKENRKITEAGKQYSKEEKYNKNKENKLKTEKKYNKNDENNYKEGNKSKYYKEKENTRYKEKNTGKTEEEIKKEYVNKKTEKVTKKVKENKKYNHNEPLNGQSYDIKEDEEQTLLIEEEEEEPQIIINKNKEKLLKMNNENTENDVEIIKDTLKNNNMIDDAKIIEITKDDEKERCDKYNKKISEEKLLQCNKKTDSIELNRTEICEKYKSEKNTQVFQEKIISDKKEEVARDILEAKQQSKCEL